MRSYNEVVSIEAINKVRIGLGLAQSKLIGYDGDDIVVRGELASWVKDIVIDKWGSDLSIKMKARVLAMGIIWEDTKIEILIPRKYAGDLELEIGVGKATISDIEVDRFKVKGGTGQIIIEDIVANSIDVKPGVGEIKMDLRRKCGNITVDAGVGNFKLALAEIGGNLKYQGGVGTAHITIPEDAPVRVNSVSGVGQCKVKAKMGNEVKYLFDLNVGVGEVKVTN